MKVNKILISQPQPATAKSPYFDIAAKYGVEFVFKPLIRVEALSAKEFRQQKVSILDHTAIDGAFNGLKGENIDVLHRS